MFNVVKHEYVLGADVSFYVLDVNNKIEDSFSFSPCTIFPGQRIKAYWTGRLGLIISVMISQDSPPCKGHRDVWDVYILWNRNIT